MTTQLQNQDPFAPMENGDFIAQMAQFSTVTGITEMSNNMKALNDKIDSFRIATASQYLGHSVLVPGNVVRPNGNDEINGVKLRIQKIDGLPPKELRKLVDKGKKDLGEGIVVVFAN